MTRILATPEKIDNVLNLSDIDFAEEMDRLRKTTETEKRFDDDDSELDWDNLPEEEKVSEEELDYMEATEAGKWDGVNDVLNEQVGNALREKDGERLRALRKDIRSGKFAEQFAE